MSRQPPLVYRKAKHVLPPRSSMMTKTIDDRGHLALGAKFAGQTVIVDDSDPDRLIVTRAKVIPAREAWLYENEQALGLLRQGLAEARAGKFSGNPPDPDADSKLVGP